LDVSYGDVGVSWSYEQELSWVELVWARGYSSGELGLSQI